MNRPSKTLVQTPSGRRIALALCVALLLSDGVLAQPSDSFNATRDRAVSLYRTGKQDEAIKLYQQLATLEPNNVDLLHDLMWALWHADRYEDAGAVAGQIHAIKPDDPEANSILGKAKPFALRAKAVAAYRAERYLEAAELYKQLAEMDPRNPSVLKDLMWSQWGAGRYIEAGDVAKTLTEMDPKDPEAWNMLGRTQMTAGMTEEALKSFQTSLDLKKDQPNTKRAIGKILVDMREFSEAIKLFEEVRSKYADTPQLYPQLAKAQFYAGLYAEAAKNFAKAVEYFPDSLNYRVHEAQALYYSGETEKGLEKLRKIGDETRSWQAIDFIVDDALSSKNSAAAANILESHLSELRPQDEPRLLRLASIYEDQKEDKKALTVVNRYLNVNPKNLPAILYKGDYMNSRGRWQESAEQYQKALLIDPYCLRAYAGLAETAAFAGQYTVALKYVRNLREQDPTNPYWVLMESEYLYEAGDRRGSRTLLSSWLEKNPGPSLPVLLYHGLTPYNRDPMLAYFVHMTVSSFEDQMRAIKEAGYTPVTAEQVAQWYQRKTELPKKPILISFDDARLDSFRYADPILKKYGLKATMFAALVNVEGNLPPSFSPWEHMKRFEQTGRWEIESHGDLAHVHIQIDPEGRRGLFLVNRQWLEKEQRYETFAEWKDRVEADHQSARQKIIDRLGHAPSAYAFPEGTYGQIDTVNSPEAVPLNLAAIRKYYSIAFYQDRYGANTRNKDPHLLARMEPHNEWTGAQLVQRLQDRNPYVLMYRSLLRKAVWSGHTHEAYKWLTELKKQGASEPLILAEEGRVRSYAGDISHAQELAQQAIGMDRDPELLKIGENIRNQARTVWTPSFTYQEDNRGREDLIFRQSLNLWVADLFRLSLLQNFGSFHERDKPRVNDTSFGFGIAKNFALFHSASFQVLQHILNGGNSKNDVSAQGNISSKWSDYFETSLSAGRDLYDTAGALSANVTERYASASFTVGSDMTKLKPTARFASLSDRNRRFTGELEASQYLDNMMTLRVIYQFVYDNMRDVSPNYYSPRYLRQHQLGLEYAPHFRRIQPFVRYLPGYGEEQGVKSGFVHDVELGLPIKFGEDTSFGPYLAFARTPTYRRNSYSVIFSHRF